MTGHPVDMLSEPYMIPIIMYLYGNGDCKKTDLYRAVSRNATMPRKLNDLESMGLITQENPLGRTWTNIHLTNMGHDVAEKLLDIDNTMTGGVF